MKKQLLNLFQDKLDYCNNLASEMLITTTNEKYFDLNEKLKQAKAEFEGMCIMLKIFQKQINVETMHNLLVKWNCAMELKTM